MMEEKMGYPPCDMRLLGLGNYQRQTSRKDHRGWRLAMQVPDRDIQLHQRRGHHAIELIHKTLGDARLQACLVLLVSELE